MGRGSRGIRSSHWSAGAGTDARWTRARSDILKDYSGDPDRRAEMQPEQGGFLVRRDGSGHRERIPCVLSPRCMERHLPVDCILFRKLPVQHRISLLSAAGVCKKCLSHSERNSDGRMKQCEERGEDDHWLCRSFSDPREGGVATRLLPVVKPQAGRLVYKCRTVIHVKSRADLETETTVFNSRRYMIPTRGCLISRTRWPRHRR